MATKVVATAYGGPEVLSVVEVDLPAPGPGEVSVAVEAVGVNPFDHKLISGAMNADPARLPLPVGVELAGVVTAVGPGAEGPAGPIAVGDQVIVTSPPGGAYADKVTVPAAKAVPKPPTLPWPEAASVLSVGGTALHTLQVVALKPGETLLVHGGSGSVGQLAVQLAVQAGATVVATAGRRNHDLLRGYGATPVTYGPGVADRIRAAAPQGIDAAIDTIGSDEAVDTSLALVADRSRIVSIVAFGRADTGIVLVSGDDPETHVRADAWKTLLPALTDGSLKIVITKAFPLTRAAEALQFVKGGHAAGKVVLLP